MRRVVFALALALLPACGDDVADTTTIEPARGATTTTMPAPGTTTTTTPGDATTTTRHEDDAVHVAVTIDGGAVSITVDGEPLDGRVRVERGSLVRIQLVTDVAEELHVHGYDHEIEAGPGETASIEFVVDIPGIFEVERHLAGHVRIFYLQVE
jgi:hypothetical protein